MPPPRQSRGGIILFLYIAGRPFIRDANSPEPQQLNAFINIQIIPSKLLY